MMRNIKVFFLLTAAVAVTSCQQEAKKPTPVAVEDKPPVVMAPFRFHKLVEVAPGNDFDVLSWGRGSGQKGSFLILHSDSAEAQYVTTTGDLDGVIVDVLNTDMDVDGNPEILIQARGKDSTNYMTMYAFEFTGTRANKLEFPKLTRDEHKGYRGGDDFYISEGKLMRKFPVYDGAGTAAKKTGQSRLLEYGLRNNNFTVRQVSKDSVMANTGKPVAEAKPEKAKTAEKSGTSSSSEQHAAEKHTSKKHHQPEHKKKKKKHRRHHSSDDDDQ